MIDTFKCCGQLMLLFSIISCNTVYARSDVIPRLSLETSYLNTRESNLSESGTIVSISPGISYQLTRANVGVSLDYQVDTFNYSGLSDEDTTQQKLSLNSTITHSPNKWFSRIFGSIAQTAKSIDGNLTSLNIPTDNTQQVHTYGVNTSYNTIIKRQLQLNTAVQVDIDFNFSTF